MKLEGINAHSVRRYFDSKTLGGYEIDELINAGLLNNKTELLSTFIKDLKAHPFIKKHTVFSPYNLDFAETAEIAEVLKEGKFFDLGKTLLFTLCIKMGIACSLSMHTGATQFLHTNFLTQYGLDNLRTSDEHL